MSEYAESGSAEIAIRTVLSLLVILNIAGNSLVCFIIIKNQDMRTSINYLIINLAAADMTVAPFFALRYIVIHTFTHPDGSAGTVLCKLVTGADMGWIGAAASIVTLVAIATERYYAVIHPYGNKGKLTTRKLKVIIPCSWLFGVIITLPMFLVRNFDKKANHCALMWSEKWMGKAYGLTWFLLMAFLPVCVMVALYSRVVYTLWFKDAEPNESNNGQQAVIKMRKRVTLMVIIVSVIFAVSWLTDCCNYLIYEYSPSYSLLSFNATATLVLFNCTINPIVYALVNQRFREKIKRMCCICCLATNRLNPAREVERIEVVNGLPPSKLRKQERVPRSDVWLMALSISLDSSYTVAPSIKDAYE